MVLKPRFSHDANVLSTARGWRLEIPRGPASRYRLSQLDDHAGLLRGAYPWRPPQTLSLRARASAQSLPGTWGFGFWNDPFGLSLGPGDSFFRLPALPNAAWFFHASPRNHLSFRNDKPAQGFLAQVFSSPNFHPSLLAAGFAFPFSKEKTRQLLSRVIDEDAKAITVDITEWHSYRLEWSPSRSAFWVDDAVVLESAVSPRPPLGLVLWIDNQFAAFTPQGKLSWGLEASPEIAGLEVEDIGLE